MKVVAFNLDKFTNLDHLQRTLLSCLLLPVYRTLSFNILGKRKKKLCVYFDTCLLNSSIMFNYDIVVMLPSLSRVNRQQVYGSYFIY